MKDAITNTGVFFPCFMAAYLPLIYVFPLVITLAILTDLLQRRFVEQFVENEEFHGRERKQK